MKNSKLIVKTKSKTYPIYFGNSILNTMGKLVKKTLPSVKKICIIADKKLPKTLLKKLIKSLKKYDLRIYKLSANEKTKSFSIANKIIEQLLKDDFNKSDCIIAFGGGILGDLSAFISNLTKRGLKFVNIPTTLLAQADASIGGKTGINSSQGKNLIGTYYQPDFVLSDVSILKSLPQREMISGYGEILKHSLILDRRFFFWLSKNGKKIINKKNNTLLANAIVKSCKIKSKVVNKEEQEKKLNHGEAVLLGMIIASEFSVKRKLLAFNEFSLIKKHYFSLKLLMNINKVFKKNEINKIIYFMKKDKKNTNEKINIILLNKIGKVVTPKKLSFKVNEIKKFLNSYYL